MVTDRHTETPTDYTIHGTIRRLVATE